MASLLLDPAAAASGEAVVTVEVAARAADSAFAPRLFSAPLPEGTEVRILEDEPRAASNGGLPSRGSHRAKRPLNRMILLLG